MLRRGILVPCGGHSCSLLGALYHLSPLRSARHSLSPGVLVDDEAGGKDILIYPKVRRLVLNTVQLWHIGPCLCDDVEPGLVVKVARFLPLVGREVNRPRSDAGLDPDVAHIKDGSFSGRCLLAKIHHQAQSANDEFVAADDDRCAGGWVKGDLAAANRAG